MALTLARAPAVAPSLSARASSRRSTSTVIVRAAAASPRELANKVRLNWRDSERRCITKTSCQTDHVKFVSLSLSLTPSVSHSLFRLDRSQRSPPRRLWPCSSSVEASWVSLSSRIRVFACDAHGSDCLRKTGPPIADSTSFPSFCPLSPTPFSFRPGGSSGPRPLSGRHPGTRSGGDREPRAGESVVGFLISSLSFYLEGFLPPPLLLSFSHPPPLLSFSHPPPLFLFFSSSPLKKQ